MKIHRFLTRAKELFLGNLDNLERCLSRISLGRSGSLQKGFIKLSSQFIFSREVPCKHFCSLWVEVISLSPFCGLGHR